MSSSRPPQRPHIRFGTIQDELMGRAGEDAAQAAREQPEASSTGRRTVTLAQAVSAANQLAHAAPSAMEVDTLHDEPGGASLSASSSRAAAEQRDLLTALRAKHASRTIVVPTNDDLVKLRLRELGEPVCLFGEGKPERRERLGDLMSQMAAEGKLDVQSMNRAISATSIANRSRPGEGGHVAVRVVGKKRKQYSSEGPDELLQARVAIAEHAKHAREARLKLARERRAAALSAKRARESAKGEDADEDQDEYANVNDSEGEDGDEEMTSAAAASDEAVAEYERDSQRLMSFTTTASEMGCRRPISSCNFSPDCTRLVMGSWSGFGQVWQVRNGIHKIQTLRGHSDRIIDVKFHPAVGVGRDPSLASIVSASADNTAKIWPVREAHSDNGTSEEEHESETTTPLATLTGHQDRLGKLAIHPMGAHAVTTSFDRTWMFWDLATQQAILEQDGHSKEVYAVSIHGDGSLVATGDLGGIGLVWDVRSGKVIMKLKGHARQVLCTDWSPNGFNLATGSGDHSIRIWDVRQRACTDIIPAHVHLVSSVKYEPQHGRFLLSSSYDCQARIWSAWNCRHVATLRGHEAPVMCADFAPDRAQIATVAYNKNWKLWAQQTTCET